MSRTTKTATTARRWTLTRRTLAPHSLCCQPWYETRSGVSHSCTNDCMHLCCIWVTFVSQMCVCVTRRGTGLRCLTWCTSRRPSRNSHAHVYSFDQPPCERVRCWCWAFIRCFVCDGGGNVHAVLQTSCFIFWTVCVSMIIYILCFNYVRTVKPLW